VVVLLRKNRLWLLGAGLLVLAFCVFCFSRSAVGGCGPKVPSPDPEPEASKAWTCTPANADMPAVDPNTLTVEQLLSHLAGIKAREDDLARKKQAVVDVLKKKLHKQQEQLKELGVIEEAVPPLPPACSPTASHLAPAPVPPP
jgi:hypothetical protein